MNVLIVGSGGREHALGWKIKQSPKLNNLFFAPGNPGTSELGVNLSVDRDNFADIKREVLENEIDMLIVGHEAPLVYGIHDLFDSDPDLQYVKVIGPKKAGAMLEGSKDFAKGFMKRHGIPTARYASFRKDTAEEGFRFLKSLNPPYVLKADGLAAGKGVLIINTLELAQDALWEMLVGKFGDAGKTVIIEEFLSGIELSVFILTDGKDYLLLPEAKDYKRIGEGDTGLNTGGMGAYAPAPVCTGEIYSFVLENVLYPTVRAMAAEGRPYRGVIYAGMMITAQGPRVLEFNTRFGDPEAQPVLMLLKTDLVDIMESVIDGRLREIKVEWQKGASVCVVMSSGGYPGEYAKGKEIHGLEAVPEGVTVFHSGTALKDGKTMTSGGRVLGVTATGEDIPTAIAMAYRGVKAISFEGMQYRRDIGQKALKR